MILVECKSQVYVRGESHVSELSLFVKWFKHAVFVTLVVMAIYLIVVV